jgi:hypothetical protein
MAIRNADHRALLDRILGDYGLAPPALEIVPDVRAWCCRNYGAKGTEQATWVRDRDGLFHIGMVDVLTDDMIEGSKNGMELLGWRRAWPPSIPA